MNGADSKFYFPAYFRQSVMRTLVFTIPVPHKGRNALVRTVMSKLHQIGVH